MAAPRQSPTRRTAVAALRTTHAETDPADARLADPLDLGDMEAMDGHHPDMADLENLQPPEEDEFVYPFEHDDDDPVPVGEHLQEPQALVAAADSDTPSDDDDPADAAAMDTNL